VAFRDDRDALLSRNRALERQVADKERLLAKKRTRLGRLEERAEAAEKERDQLARELRRLEPEAGPQSSRRRRRTPIVLLALLGVVASGLGYVFLKEGRSPPASEPAAALDPARPLAEAPDRVVEAAPVQDRAAERRRERRLARVSLDRTDHVLREALRTYPGFPLPANRIERWQLASWFQPRDFDRAAATLRQLGEGEPYDPDLGEASLALAAAITELTPILEELLLYVGRRAYLDDGFARARALEPGLREAARAYLVAADALRALLADRAGDVFAAEEPLDVTTFVAWRACSGVADAIAPVAVDATGLGVGPVPEPHRLKGAVIACAEAADALRVLIRSQESGRDYVLKLYDGIVEHGTTIVHADSDRRVTGGYSALAQVHAYAADQFARLAGIAWPPR
jgi:hypothetical protein